MTDHEPYRSFNPMDYKDANSSFLAKFAVSALAAAVIIWIAGAGPSFIVVVVIALLAVRSFANNLGGGR